MAQFEGSYVDRTAAAPSGIEAVSGWAVGLTFFASLMLVLLGIFHFVEGLAAVIDDTFYVVRPNFALKMDVTAWGWLHMIGGILVVLSGIWLMTGALLARIVAILFAILSAIGNFYSIPYYPVWSILMIALDIGVIWGVTAYGHYMSETSQ
jgi:hypothetical protein